MTQDKQDQSQKKSGSGPDRIPNDMDRIDDALLELINKRLDLSGKLGDLPGKEDDMSRQAEQERKTIQRLLEINNGPMDKILLTQLFTDIFSACREIRQKQRITFLGPEATFTHIAAMQHFGRSATFLPQPTIRDIFVEVEKGNADYGVVPVENSIEGSVNYTLDLFFDSNLRICAEKYLTISQDLLSVSGAMEDIKVVYSHPQPIGQCRGWLRKNLPNVRIEECSSTSYAAKKVCSEPDAAAIASSEAARLYNLNVVASKIEDQARNMTRFLIIGKDTINRSGDDKTSIMFAASHIPGALYKTLGPIADAGLNMMKLESRPTKYENWSYFFFVDLEGHMDDAQVRDTVEKMKPLCLFMKYLGSYPRSEY